MEIWLSIDNGAEKLRLPVLPAGFEVAVGNMNTRVNINEIGNINLIGKSDLKELGIESFFPNQAYYFVEYNDFPLPYACVEIIESWRLSGKPIRLIITNAPINLPMAIEEFVYGERDGTGDIYYKLELAEYKFVGIKETSESKGYVQEQKRPSKDIPKEYIVKPGDTLWAIAKKLTGNGANYPAIARKNNIQNPNLIHPGQRLVI